jgi:hypothetical protein
MIAVWALGYAHNLSKTLANHSKFLGEQVALNQQVVGIVHYLLQKDGILDSFTNSGVPIVKSVVGQA